MKNKFYIVLLAFSIIPTASQAGPLPDEVGVCYEFKADEMIRRDICIITEGNAAGGMYANLQLVSGKEHQIASHGISGLNDGLYDLNGKDAVHYLRDAAFYNTTDYDGLSEINEPALYCYKTKVLDLCHN